MRCHFDVQAGMKKMKEIFVLVFAILAFRIQVSTSQAGMPYSCLYDHLECQYNNKRLVYAGPNQFTIHHTLLRQNQSGFYECLVRSQEQYRNNIAYLGTKELRVIRWPGYSNIQPAAGTKLLAEYRIQCSSDEFIFFNITDIHVQPTNCPDQKCNLLIDEGIGNATELCNMTTHTVSGSNATIRLATWEDEHRFTINAVCFKPEERDLPGCSEKGPVYQAFTNQWNEGEECRNSTIRFQEIDVENSNLTYTNGAIVITTETNQLSVINDVVLLHILCNYDEASLHTQYAEDSDGRPKVFRGSGTLTVMGSSAYLFLTDGFLGGIHSCDPVIRAWGRILSTFNRTRPGCSSPLSESESSVFAISAVSSDEFKITCTPHIHNASDEWNCSAHCGGPRSSENLVVATSGVNTSLTITLENPCNGLTCYCNVTATVGENMTSGQIIIFGLRGEDTSEREPDSECSLDDLTSTPDEVNELCLSIPHGLVCYSGNSNASVAVYMCSDGYFLEGNSERVCQPNGNWSGTTPQCIAEEEDAEGEEDGKLSSAAMVSITAVLCTLIFLVIGAVIGALIGAFLYHLFQSSASSKPSYGDAVSEVYDELPTPTIKLGGIPLDEKSQDINTVKNESYEERATIADTPQDIYECIHEVNEQGNSLAVKDPQEIETDINYAYGQREVLAAITAQPTNEMEHAV